MVAARTPRVNTRPALNARAASGIVSPAMPKDQPIRNPILSPAGLLPEEIGRHRPKDQPAPRSAGQAERCRFVASWGGVQSCKETSYLSGFCRFHYDCLSRGEISPLGRILDVVKDQRRRREINWHGIDLPSWERLPEDPLTGERR